MLGNRRTFTKKRSEPVNSHSSNNAHHEYQKKAPLVTISNSLQFPAASVFGSLEYPSPAFCTKRADLIFKELPKMNGRPSAKWIGPPLASTFHETLGGSIKEQREANDQYDPAVLIVSQKRKVAKIFRLGSIQIDITKEGNGIDLSNSNKLINKILQKDSLMASTPSMKRNRDEIVDASSSLKKNRRMRELLQQDTTMELSFEGKAMDKYDYVKLVDSSSIADESHLIECEPITNFDTKHLLQSTDFNFEFKN